ncbi:MAG: tetratricopeptide repeat protein [Hyphomicrobiaceae bacterium]
MTLRMTLSVIAATAAMALALPTAQAMDSKKVKKSGPDLTAVRANIKKEDWKQAIALLQPLTKSHPKSADVFNLLGYTQRKTGKFDVSLTSYKRALELDPAHLEAHVYLGELYIQTKQLDKAVAQSKIIAKLCPKGCKPRAELEAALKKATW